MDWSGPGVGAKVSAFRRDVIDLDIVTREVRERSMFGFVCLLHKYSFTEVGGDSCNFLLLIIAQCYLGSGIDGGGSAPVEDGTDRFFFIIIF